MLNTIVQVARLYYDQALSQKEIADRLGVSRSSIAKYLIEAREQGIVEIRIIDPSKTSSDLSQDVRDQYKLKFVEVVPSSHKSFTLSLQAAGHAAAKYIAKHIQNNEKLGIAWGRSTKSLVDQIAGKHINKENIEIVPLMGESSNKLIHTRMNQLVERFAQTVSGKPNFLFYPMIVDSKTLYNRLMSEEALQNIAKLWENLDWAFMGIGALPPTAGMNLYIPEAFLPDLEQRKAVGDICGRYFDIAGRIVKPPFSDRVVGVGIEHLQSAKRVVGIAAGADKEKALRGALNTGLLSDIFIDQELASRIVD